jgi:2-polyprenyl-6-methoxyphenol hydroxylase-like FAD-dependent oxidoreductase
MQLQKAERWYRMLRAAPHMSQLTDGIDPRDAHVRCYPVPSYCLDRLCGERWLAIGDAASAYDPITAQGIVKSLSNGIHAAQAIQSWMSGTSDALQAFAQLVRTQYRRYVDLRRDLYRLEQRWPASEFWQRQITSASM